MSITTNDAELGSTATKSDVPEAADLPTSTTLVDGATVQIRRLGSDDYDAIVRLAETLTEQERYMRFFTAYPRYLDEWALSLSAPTEDQYALGVFEGDDLIATANWVMTERPGYAEVSVVVAHLQHERGVGTALLRALGVAAHRRGIHHLIADVLAENHSLRKVVVDAGWPCQWHGDGAVFSIDLDIDALGD